MKNQNKLITEILIIFLSIFLALYAWKYIFLPYEKVDIYGEYANKSYNSLNDFARYAFFILFPILVLFALKFFYNKNPLNNFIKNISAQNENIKKDFSLRVALITILIFSFAEFFSISLNQFNLDVYHDGQKITSAYKSFLDGSLWSGSYVTVGIFYETLMSKLSWMFLGVVSIGASKFVEFFLILITKILLIFLAYQISKFSRLNKNYQLIFFLTLSFLFLSLNDYNLSSVDQLSYRDIPILILVILFPYIEQKKFLAYPIVIFLGFTSLLVFFWSIDRAIVFNLLLIILLFYFVIKSNFKLFAYLIISLFFSYILFPIILGDEFQYFLSNSMNILREMNYIHGIIHPNPLSSEENSSRALKTILIIIFSILVSLNTFFSSDKKIYFFQKILLLISICSVLSYLYALGRSDGPHIRSTFGFPMIFISTYFIFYILLFFQNKLSLNINIQKLNVLILILTFFSGFIYFNVNFNQIISFEKRFNIYINQEDKRFLSEDYNLLLNDIRYIIEDQKCIQLFTNSAIMPYLLKKKNCTKYYFVWSIGSEKIQKNFIRELKDVKFILSDKINDYHPFSPNKKLPIVKSYIETNYFKYKSYELFDLLKKNE